MHGIDFHQIRIAYARELVLFFSRPVDRIADHEIALWVHLHAATFADRIAA